jgi:hypothetical protein
LKEVKEVILVYILFALTFSLVLTAFFAGNISQHRQGHAFIFFFILLMLLAAAVDVWLVPIAASEQRGSLFPGVFLAVFATILAASVILSVRSPRRMMLQAAPQSNSRLDTEAVVFDSIIWLAVLISGIAVLKAAGI